MPARGVERWLSQRLSHRLGRGDTDDGVCAGVAFRSPRTLVAEVTGLHHEGGDDDPWAPDALVWPLLGVVDASAGEEWCRTLGAHLGHGQTGEEGELRRGRRYAVARRLARLFASYAVQRPRLLADWEAGVDSDGVGCPARPRPALAARALATAGGGRRRAQPGGAPCPRARRAARRTAGGRPAGAAVAVRPHPDRGHGGRAARGARRAPRRARVAAAPVRRALAVADRAGRGRAAPRRHLPPAGRPPAARVARTRRARAGAHAAGAAADGRACRDQGADEDLDKLDRRGSLLSWLQADIAANTTVDPAGRVARRRRPQRAGARVPRPGPPGRGAARGAARAARRRHHARAARHPGDVPRHRGLRPAGRGGVRHGSRPSRAATPASCSRCVWPTGR